MTEWINRIYERKKNVRFKKRLRKYKERTKYSSQRLFSVGGVSAMTFMKTKSVLASILLIMFSGFANAQDAELRATVESLQGTAQAFTGEEPTQEELRTGSLVRPWDSISVGEKSKLLLSWKNGLLGSIGELSDISLASGEMENREVPSIEITDGIFRFTTQQDRVPFFSVNTPLVSIYPATNEPVDFSVEVYTPESTLVTVLRGTVALKKLNGEEIAVPSCHNILIEEGKDASDLVAIQPDDIKRLVEATTIPGTVVADLGQCGIPSAAEAVPVGPPQAAIAADYYVEDWGPVEDEYPFYDVSVLPPASPDADYIAVIPGIGRFVMDIPFAVDPAIVAVYIQEVFFQRGVFFCRDYLAGLRLRQRELARLLYLARMTGNVNLLRQTQRRLDDLTIRTNWAARNVNRLDHRLAGLRRQQGDLSARLPRGADLSGVISASLKSPSNSAADRKFQDRLRSDINVQTRLANMAGQEMGSLRQRIANEPNLGKRLAMRQELSRIHGDVASGKALIPRNQAQVDTLVKQLVKTRDPDKRGQLENQLAGQLKGYETPESGDFATKELASVRQDLNKIPNQQGREVFQKRAAALEQSIDARRQAESNTEKTQKNIEDLSKQVATERNPEKRNELVGRLKDLTKSLSAAGPGSLQFLEKLKLGKPQAVPTEPRALTGTPEIQKPLERQPLERARQQQQIERQKQTEQQLQQRQPEQQKQSETRQQQLQKKQTHQEELRRQQMLDRQKELQPRTRQQQLQQRQIEGAKQFERRPEELQKQQAHPQDLRQQQLLERQRDVETRQLELQRQQTREQESRQRQLENQKQKQELERQRTSREQAARQQQMLEQQRQQQIRQQQLQQEQSRQRRLQEQPVRQQQPQLQQQQQERQRQMLQQQGVQRQLQQERPQNLPGRLPQRLEDEKKRR
jgi:hypothetical protein